MKTTQRRTSHQRTSAKPEASRGQAEQASPMSAMQMARRSPSSLTPGQIMQLQKTIGNRAVSQLFAPQKPVQMFGGIFGHEKNAPENLQEERKDEVEQVQTEIRKLIDTLKKEESEEKAKLETKRFEKIKEINDKYPTLVGTNVKEVNTLIEQLEAQKALEVQAMRDLDQNQLTDDIKQARQGLNGLKGNVRRQALDALHNLEDRQTQNRAAYKLAFDKNRDLKQQIEAQKAVKKLFNDRDGERRDYLRNQYVPALRQIGITPEKLKARLPNTLQMEAGGADEQIIKYDGMIVYKILTGNNAFEKVDTGEVGLARDVYVKKGSNKQYIEDDRGVFTRRFAYAEKSKKQMDATLNVNKPLLGRYAEAGNSLYKKSDRIKETYGFTTGPDEDMNVAEMLYVHQEKGSGDEQRGVSISSTNKPLHGNSGDEFKSPGGYTLKIDLAKVPKGPDNLFNLYSKRAQDQTIGLERKGAKGKIINDAAESKAHTDDSTAKNRELFLRELRDDWVEKTQH